MTLCAGDCDANSGEIDHLPSDLLTFAKGKLNRLAPSNFSFVGPIVPDHEVDELTPLERQFAMQSRDCSVWARGNSPWIPCSADGEGTVSPMMNPARNDNTLDAMISEAVHAVDVPLRHVSYQDDELLSWIQYPIDHPPDRGSDWFADFSSSFKAVKHSLDGLSQNPQATSLAPPGTEFRDIVTPSPAISGLSILSAVSQSIEPTGSCGGDSREVKNVVAGADAAAVAGAGWGADLTSQSGAVFNEGRDQPAIQPSLAGCLHSAAANGNMKALDVESLDRKTPHERSFSQRQNPPELDPSAYFTPPQSSRTSVSRNFSLFSRSVADTKASLHMVGAGSGPTNIERVRQQIGNLAQVELNAKKSSSEKTVTTPNDRSSNVAATRYSGGTHETRQTTAGSSCGQQSDEGKGKETCRESVFNSSVCFSAVTASEKCVETLEAADQTATSPSRGSGNSTEKSGKEAVTTLSRKFSAGEDSEYQSEDLEEFGNHNKKSTSGVKRSRAAAIHNESERRRRDRINEKMKALQDLIPNANKTDKASMLDEVIEYMKLLQSQLQTMCMRTGMGIPPTMIPGMGMQHMQIPALTPHMGLGMGLGMGVGMGMGMGMGMMDVNAGAGQPIMPMRPLHCQLPLGAPSNLPGLQACTPLSMAETHFHLQSSGIMDPYNPFLSHQQIQPAPMNLNMHRNLELYNAYLQQQMQQPQQHQQQQPQQRMH